MTWADVAKAAAGFVIGFVGMAWFMTWRHPHVRSRRAAVYVCPACDGLRESRRVPSWLFVGPVQRLLWVSARRGHWRYWRSPGAVRDLSVIAAAHAKDAPR